MRSRDGKVRAKVMDRVTADNIQEYLNQNIKQGATISTDEASFYIPVDGFEKLLVNHSVSEFVNDLDTTNGIESIWAVLKRGHHGTFHHFSKKHLDRYVNEFVFRMNEGNVRIDILDRMKSVVKNMAGKKLPYKELIADS